MPQVVIENPILNSPFAEPRRHYKFDEDGITDEIADTRRPSSYFIPIAAPKKKTKQPTFDTLAPEGFLAWMNAACPAGETELTEVPLTVEGMADATEDLFRRRVEWWGG